jgi:hypothetical protein
MAALVHDKMTTRYIEIKLNSGQTTRQGNSPLGNFIVKHFAKIKPVRQRECHLQTTYALVNYLKAISLAEIRDGGS